MPVTVLWSTRDWGRAIASILEKEQRIAEIMGHVQKLLAGGGS